MLIIPLSKTPLRLLVPAAPNRRDEDLDCAQASSRKARYVSDVSNQKVSWSFDPSGVTPPELVRKLQLSGLMAAFVIGGDGGLIASLVGVRLFSFLTEKS